MVFSESPPLLKLIPSLTKCTLPSQRAKNAPPGVSAAETLGAGKVRSNGPRIVQFQAHTPADEVRSPHVRTWRIPGAAPSPGLAAEVPLADGQRLAQTVLDFFEREFAIAPKDTVVREIMARVVQSVHSDVIRGPHLEVGSGGTSLTNEMPVKRRSQMCSCRPAASPALYRWDNRTGAVSSEPSDETSDRESRPTIAEYSPAAHHKSLFPQETAA